MITNRAKKAATVHSGQVVYHTFSVVILSKSFS